MGYPQEQMGMAVVPASNAYLTAMTVTTAASGVYARWICMRRVMLKQLLFHVTVGITCGTADPVVLVRRRPTFNSTTGQVSVGAITIPTTTAIGTVMYKNITPTTFFPGDEISFEVGTGGTDGSAATGAGFVGFLFDLEPELAAEEDDMTASA
jgi:hypothetical protein